jgi:hypothetical protein
LHFVATPSTDSRQLKADLTVQSGFRHLRREEAGRTESSGRDMETLQATQIAIKNILFATDFEAPASRALPFAVAMATRYGARLYVSHVIPQEAYACASPQAVDRVLKEAGVSRHIRLVKLWAL